MSMLSEADREIVLRRLSVWLADPPPKQVLLASMLPDEHAFFMNLDLSGAPAVQARGLLAACEQRGWPPVGADGVRPLPILRRVLDEIASFQEIADVLRRLVAPVVPDPFDSPLLIGNRAFVSRMKSRELLRRMVQGTVPMIAVVNGERLSGRSHTAYLVGYASNQLGGFSFATVEVRPESASQWTVDEVARSLVGRITGRALPAVPPGLSEMPARRAHQLADWVLGEATSAAQDWWIVLDGVSHVRDGTLFIEAIGEYFSKNTLLRRIRLLLIDHPSSLPDSVDPIAELDELPAPAQQFTDADIQDFFRGVLADRTVPAELQEAARTAAAEVQRRAGQYVAGQRVLVLGRQVQAVTNEILAAR